jgi:malonyl CoA-acyl carrier protein transacylase
MLTYLFPGQGAQFKGMGSELFSEFPELCELASKELGYCLKTLCLKDADQQLHLTEYTQPALYTVNALHYFKRMQQTNQPVDFVAGHSLGEYNALLAAGVFDFETGLKLVKKRAQLMQLAHSGAMAAIIGPSSHELEDLLQANKLPVSIANYNTHQQNVIAGSIEAMQQAQDLFQQKNLTYIPLRVSGAFHTQHMQSAAETYLKFLDNFEFKIPKLPVIANYNAEFYHPAVIKQNLAHHLSHPVQWVSSMEFLLAQDDMNFEEVGPGKILTGLLAQIKKQCNEIQDE